MKNFLMHLALKDKKYLDDYIIEYYEDINPDAIDGEKWLEKNTSYIWKIGTLALIDSNKCDFVTVYIAHQRNPYKAIESIGNLYWSNGENDDIGRSLDRYLRCLRNGHNIFDAN